MANLLDSLKGYLTPELIAQASGALGENENGITKALGGLIPSILGGITQKASSADGLSGLFSLLNDDRNDNLLGNLSGLIGGGNLAHNDPKDLSGRLMSMIFGDKVGAMISGIASFAGIKSSSASGLLGLAGPMIMGLLRNKIVGGNLNAAGLASMLMGEKSSIMSAIPSVLTGALGLGSFTGNKAAETVASGTSGMGWLKWLLPLVLLAGLTWFLSRSCNKQDTVDAITAPVTEAADAVKEKTAEATEAVKGFFKKTLPSGFAIEGSETGIESQLISFIEDAKRPVDKTTWFNFDALNFKTASADLNLDFSQKQLNNIVEVLKAFPAVKLKIGGYTDSDGDEKSNLKLSQQRAETVMQAIVAAGIDAGRLAAEGYGEQHPVCPTNDTPECKAQNRRISVRVTAK